MLSSCVYHIMSVFLPHQKEGKEIDKLTQKALWGLFTSKRYQIKISYCQTEMPVLNGGLGIWSAQCRAIAIFLSSLTRNAVYIVNEPESNLSLICKARKSQLFVFLTCLVQTALQAFLSSLMQ